MLSHLGISEDDECNIDTVLEKFGVQSKPEEPKPSTESSGPDASKDENQAKEDEIDESKVPMPEEMPSFPEDVNSLLKQHLTEEILNELKEKKTEYGTTVWDVMRCGVLAPKCKLGVAVGDDESYATFGKLLDPIVEAYHAPYKLSEGHKRDLDPSHLGEAAENPDPEGKFIRSTRIRVARNLKGYPLPPKVNAEQRLEIERKIVEALNTLEGDLAGTYYSLSSMDDETRQRLEEDHFLFRKEHGYFAYAGVYRDWPEGRGIFHNPDKTFLVWVNEEDEMRIISMQNGGNIGDVFARLCRGVNALESKLDYLFSDTHGFIASCPSNLGTGMRASVHIDIPLASKDARFKQICDELGLQPRGIHGEHSEAGAFGGVYDISPLKRLGWTEVDCAKQLHKGVVQLIALEKELQVKKEEEELRDRKSVV